MDVLTDSKIVKIQIVDDGINVTWSDGYSCLFTPSDIVGEANSSFARPLLNQDFFAQAKISSSGKAIQWPNGFDVHAGHLRLHFAQNAEKRMERATGENSSEGPPENYIPSFASDDEISEALIKSFGPQCASLLNDIGDKDKAVESFFKDTPKLAKSLRKGKKNHI